MNLTKWQWWFTAAALLTLWIGPTAADNPMPIVTTTYFTISDDGLDGTPDRLTENLAYVGFTIPPQASPPGFESRGYAEYDIRELAGTVIAKAEISFRFVVFDTDLSGKSVFLSAYEGNGQPDLSDFNAPSLVLSVGILPASSAGVTVVDVTPAVISLLGVSDFLGFEFFVENPGVPGTFNMSGEARPILTVWSSQLSKVIDIKPGNKKNIINPRSKGGIWVAILSDTNADSPFDPSSQVDIPTVEFGPNGAKSIRYKVKDINKDGLGDLLLRFRTPEIGITCGDAEATLTGKTFEGQSFSGTDVIKTVGCDKPKVFDKKKRKEK